MARYYSSIGSVAILLLFGGCVARSGAEPSSALDCPAPAPAPAPAEPEGRPLDPASLAFTERAEALADRDHLARAFAAAGYAPPPGAYLLVARVLPGAGQPAFEYFSLGDTGVVPSPDHYWPASTIKLMAAIGALATLGEHGFTGAAEVDLTDRTGRFRGPLALLMKEALVVSDNDAYNRLMLIAGFDALNVRHLGEARGFRHTVLQRLFYDPGDRASARDSPSFRLSEGERTLTVPERHGRSRHRGCPDDGNCTSLLELLEALRRVTLHEELPEIDRFPLGDADLARLRSYLDHAPSRMQPGLSEALGSAVLVYNKTGTVRTDDRLDHALVVDLATGRRFLIAQSLPYGETDDTLFAELARQAIRAVAAAPSGRVAPVQEDAGELEARRLEDGRVLLRAPDAEAYRAFIGTTAIDVEDGVLDPGLAGSALLVAEAIRDGRPVACRTFVLE